MLAQEYSTEAASDMGTGYLTGDHVGSVRLQTGAEGTPPKRKGRPEAHAERPAPSCASIKGCFDFAPFGETLNGQFGRTGDCFGSATPTQGNQPMFTGQYRDKETEGIDFFEARFYASAQGRFLSPDAPLVDQNPEDPQSWNLYAALRNNPLGFVDPTGEYLVQVGSCYVNREEGRVNGELVSTWDTSPWCPGHGNLTQIELPPLPRTFSLSTIGPIPPVNKLRVAACSGDSALRAGVGFIPGGKAVKAAGKAAEYGFAASELAGHELNPLQSAFGYRSVLSDSGIVDYSAGAYDIAELNAKDEFKAAGEDFALLRAQQAVKRSSFARKSAAKQAKLLDNANRLANLKAAGSYFGLIGNVLSIGDAAFEIKDCFTQR